MRWEERLEAGRGLVGSREAVLRGREESREAGREVWEAGLECRVGR